MEHTKYALVAHYRQKWCVWTLISFLILDMNFSALNFKARKNFVLVIKNT